MRRKGKIGGPTTSVEGPPGEKTAESSPLGGGASRGGSAYGPLEFGTLLAYPKPNIVTSPFGQSYLDRRQRPIPADEVQAACTWQAFCSTGYSASAGAVATAAEYAAALNVFYNWYTYARQMGKTALKYKHTPTTLNDPNIFWQFLDVYYYAVHNCAIIFRTSSLIQFNQAMGSFSQYLPNKLGRINRLWARLSAIPMPAILKEWALRTSQIVWEPGRLPLIFTLADDAPLVPYGGSSDYTVMASNTVPAVFASDSLLNSLLDNIEKAVWCLENNVSYSANVASDLLAVRDVIDMIRDIVPGAFEAGLPRLSALPPLSQDPGLVTEYLARGLYLQDTKGVSADQMIAFPVNGISDFNGLIPVRGWGGLEVKDFTYLGFPKFFTLNDSTTGTRYTDTSNHIVIYGTNIPSWGKTIYTREDAWISADQEQTDFGDGAAIRANENVRDLFLYRHVYQGHKYAAQLTTNQEFRFMDEVRTDYTVWEDPDDLGGNYGQMWAMALGVPYLA